jgi:hypothetical protein
MNFVRPIWAGLLAVIAFLVPRPTFCPDAGAAERRQEKLYLLKLIFRFLRECTMKLRLSSIQEFTFQKHFKIDSYMTSYDRLG